VIIITTGKQKVERQENSFKLRKVSKGKIKGNYEKGKEQNAQYRAEYPP
jgi:hypothetical protein